MSGGDFERGSLGSRGSLPSCSTTTRVNGGPIGSPERAGATWPLPSFSAPLSHLYFGRQVHATRFFVWSQLLLGVIALILLLSIATDTVQPARFDWIVQPSYTTEYHASLEVNNDSDNTTTVEAVNVDRNNRHTPSEYARRREWGTYLAGVAYFYIISIFLAWWGVQAAEARGRREEATDGECRATASARDECAFSRWVSRCGSTSCLRRFTITLLLVPWLLSVFSLLLPLPWISLRLISDKCYYLSYNEKTSMSGASLFGYELWYKYMPLAVVWLIAGYFVYGCVLAFVFTWRRADGRFGYTYGTMHGMRRAPPSRGVPLRECAAAASFSWTFRGTKERYRITNKDGELNKSTYSMASNKSYKSTRNPTLRGFTRKTDDMDVSLISEENYAGGDSLDRNYNNNGYNSSSAPPAGPYICTLTTISNTGLSRRMTQSEQMRASRGFSAYSGAGVSRAPLEPVEEEEFTPTPEKTAENGDLRM